MTPDGWIDEISIHTNGTSVQIVASISTTYGSALRTRLQLDGEATLLIVASTSHDGLDEYQSQQHRHDEDDDT
jgi:hypothetical protein